MSQHHDSEASVPDDDTVTVIRTGTEEQFGRLVDAHRAELRLHCYRLMANVDDADDMVQETFVRAWRSRTTFEGRSTLRAWLYRIATNACMDTVRQRQRRVKTVPASIDGRAHRPSFDDVPWLQPLPQHLLPDDETPDAVLVAKETIELAFLAAIQHLEPRPRAVLVLRDVLGWRADETAEALGITVTSANSVLQRARAKLRELGRPGRLEWTPLTPPSAEERQLVQRYMDAHAHADARAVIALLDRDVMFSMPPFEAHFEGVEEVAAFFVRTFGTESPGQWQLRYTEANGQPAAANYVMVPGDTVYRAFTLDVLRISSGRIVEITTFDADRFPHFGLPTTLTGPAVTDPTTTH